MGFFTSIFGNQDAKDIINASSRIINIFDSKYEITNQDERMIIVSIFYTQLLRDKIFNDDRDRSKAVMDEYLLDDLIDPFLEHILRVKDDVFNQEHFKKLLKMHIMKNGVEWMEIYIIKKMEKPNCSAGIVSRDFIIETLNTSSNKRNYKRTDLKNIWWKSDSISSYANKKTGGADYHKTYKPPSDNN